MVAVIGAFVVLMVVNPAIFPLPLDPKPIDVLVLVQVKVPPAGELIKLVGEITSLLHTTLFAGTVTVGVGLIVIVFESAIAEQPPEAAMVLITVYVPGVLADKSTCPVVVLTKTKAGEALKIPALAPGPKVGKGSVPSGQYAPPYVKEAEGDVVMVTVVVLFDGQTPVVVKVMV